jgi:hypothetical protein
MCENCFLQGILRFDSQKDFEDAETLIDKKINDKQLVLIRDENHENWDFKLIYQCTSCKEEWILSIPDNAYRGYLLIKSEAIKKGIRDQSEKKNNSIGCVIILVLIIATILYLII